MTTLPSPEWFAREEERIKLVCVEQARQMLAERPELAMLYSQGELAGTIFLAICSDLAAPATRGLRADLH